MLLVNLERVDRGLRPIAGLVASINKMAKISATAEMDPQPIVSILQRLGVHRFKVLWADDYGVLAADYEWMYNDGYSGVSTTNVGCTLLGAAGCWAHRSAILDPFRGLPVLTAGTGWANLAADEDSVAAILVGGHGHMPRLTYSWRQALAHGANGHRHSHRGH